jgi:hypothetical protein
MLNKILIAGNCTLCPTFNRIARLSHSAVEQSIDCRLLSVRLRTTRRCETSQGKQKQIYLTLTRRTLRIEFTARESPGARRRMAVPGWGCPSSSAASFVEALSEFGGGAWRRWYSSTMAQCSDLFKPILRGATCRMEQRITCDQCCIFESSHRACSPFHPKDI